MSENLSFAQLSASNHKRAERWHAPKGIEGWSVSDWSNAAAGEMGEICNAVKKLRRIEDSMPNINEPGREIQSVEEARRKIGEEIADTIIYLDLLATRIGLSTARLVREKFNAVSDKYGFEERV